MPAAAFGVNYPELVSDRLARPLRRDTIFVQVPGSEDCPQGAPGLSVFNRRQMPWTGEGYAPS